MTVEDLFRAKEERRKRLAKLPFEEKIRIVKKLQTISAAIKGEKAIFSSFLKAFPDFAGEPLQEWDKVEEWYANRATAPPAPPYDKRPDIIARTVSGRMVGIELKRWINQDQIDEARSKERIQDYILNAIGRDTTNPSKLIGRAELFPKEVRFPQSEEASGLRSEFLALLGEVDKSWAQNNRLSEPRNDFEGFPILGKYLKSVVFRRRPHQEVDWVVFPSSVSYSTKPMLDTLEKALLAHRDDDRYKDLGKHVGLDESYLLVHYDFKAFAYNTPFDAPNFGFEQAAEFARGVLNGNGGYFDRIFLFNFLFGKQEAYRIF
jgi:hypothetical protein